MNIIGHAELRRLTKGEIEDLMPMIVTNDGEPYAVIDKPENVITLSDIHIRVRNMLRAMEKRARGGMPPPVKIALKEIMEARPPAAE